MTWPAIPYYCINLSRNTQRWDDSVKEFLKAGLNYVEQVKVEEPADNRFLGFNRSMHMVIKMGYETGGNFLIFEDDIAFERDVWKLEHAFNELPEDFDLMYLGCNFFGNGGFQLPVKYSRHLAQLPDAWQSHAILYSNKAAKFVLDNFDPETFPVLDEWLRVNVMPQGKCYLVNPMVCYQRPGYSDLWQVNAEYGCHVPGNLILQKL